MYILSSPSAPPPHTPLPLYRKLVHANDWLIGPDLPYLCCSERWMGGDYTLKLTSMSKLIMDFVFNCFLFHSTAFVIYQCIHCNRYNIAKSVYDIVTKVLICNFYLLNLYSLQFLLIFLRVFNLTFVYKISGFIDIFIYRCSW